LSHIIPDHALFYSFKIPFNIFSFSLSLSSKWLISFRLSCQNCAYIFFSDVCASCPVLCGQPSLPDYSCNPVWEHTVSFREYQSSSFMPLQKSGTIMLSYILNFTFLDSRWIDKSFWTELKGASVSQIQSILGRFLRECNFDFLRLFRNFLIFIRIFKGSEFCK
jgi:hypothetical protein